MANQIAAGEVIENPASVVKELVENALDADAKKITVATDGASCDVIRVHDDGEGMTETDATLALERHATSKIHKPEDLINIGTLGFRGEALPSISSVSRLTLATRARGTPIGTQVIAVPGSTLEKKPVGTPEGTRIEIRDLFFNTPARKKFLKSQSTETARITELVTRLALCKPEVAFTLIRNGKQGRTFLTRTNFAERVREVVRSKVHLREATGALAAVRVEAWLTGPEDSRIGARGLHLLVNGRLIRDPGLMRSIWYAYDKTLEQGHYPIGVVSITIEPHLVDVNVHPQKAEVRFVDRGMVHGAVSRVVGTLLRDRAHAIAGGAGHPVAHPQPTTSPLFTPDSWQAQSPEPQPGLWSSDEAHSTDVAGAAQLEEPHSAQTADVTTPSYFSALRFLATAGSAWLVCEGPEGLVIIDQHAAHERITFERLREAYRTRKPKIQQLLVPEQVEVSPRELDVLTQNADHLAVLGLEVEPFSTTSVTISAVPSPLDKADPRRLLDEVLAELSALQTPMTSAMDRVIARLACHGSVRAGSRLAPEEVEALLQDLDRAELGGHCPHGRPVSLNLTWGEIERRLGRH